jgi:hypothetical protein
MYAIDIKVATLNMFVNPKEYFICFVLYNCTYENEWTLVRPGSWQSKQPMYVSLMASLRDIIGRIMQKNARFCIILRNVERFSRFVVPYKICNLFHDCV